MKKLREWFASLKRQSKNKANANVSKTSKHTGQHVAISEPAEVTSERRLRNSYLPYTSEAHQKNHLIEIVIFLQKRCDDLHNKVEATRNIIRDLKTDYASLLSTSWPLANHVYPSRAESLAVAALERYRDLEHGEQVRSQRMSLATALAGGGPLSSVPFAHQKLRALFEEDSVGELQKRKSRLEDQVNELKSKLRGYKRALVVLGLQLKSSRQWLAGKYSLFKFVVIDQIILDCTSLLSNDINEQESRLS